MDLNAIFTRAKALILKPKETWAVVREEATTVNEIFKGYVLILAAIPPAAGFLGILLFGRSYPFAHRYHPPFFRGLVWAIVLYLLSLIAVFITAKVVEVLAPTFQGKKDYLRAFKVVAYSMTAVWVADILTIIPSLSPLATILGLYSLYLLYLGLPFLMECPAEKALSYTILIVVVMILIYIIIGLITGGIIAVPAVLKGF